MTKKPTITFAPGCFDTFEGTQEELDALVNEIKEVFEREGSLDNAILLDDMDEEELNEILKNMPDDDIPRTLQ